MHGGGVGRMTDRERERERTFQGYYEKLADERITRYGFPDSRDNEFHELRARAGKIALDGSLRPDG